MGRVEFPLSTLTAAFAPGCRALALTGSHARGDATPHSDIDLLRFMDNLPPPGERYTLRVWRGRMVSLTATTLAEQRERMAHPVTAIFAVPGLRQMIPLHDPAGELAVLRAEALAFTWEPLQPAADRYAAEELTGLAEEAGKALSALARADEPAALYAAYGLVLGLTRALLAWRGALVESENRFFAAALAAAGHGSLWAAALRAAAGFEPPPPGALPALARARAALRLYAETAALLDGLLAPHQQAVVALTLRAANPDE